MTRNSGLAQRHRAATKGRSATAFNIGSRPNNRSDRTRPFSRPRRTDLPQIGGSVEERIRFPTAAQPTVHLVAAEFERLAFEAALRGLEKQERLLEELRARTGVLLAASSLAASFLGQRAFQEPHPGELAVVALAAFVVSIVASVYILLPKSALIFSESGTGLYEGLYEVRDDIPEVYRRLAYDLERFWDSNDPKLRWLTRTYGLAAVALVAEILCLAALLSGSIF